MTDQEPKRDKFGAAKVWAVIQENKERSAALAVVLVVILIALVV